MNIDPAHDEANRDYPCDSTTPSRFELLGSDAPGSEMLSGEEIQGNRATSPLSLDTSISTSNASTSEFRENYLKTLCTAQKQRHALSRQEMSFDEYLDLVIQNPKQYVRGPAQYLVDTLQHFGSVKKTILGREVEDFNIKNRPWRNDELNDHTELVGQEIPLYEYYLENKLNARMAHPARLYVFHGPPGSGKTLLSDILDEGLEIYSTLPEGALYRLFFEFDDPKLARSFGLAGIAEDMKLGQDDFGSVRDDDIEERRDLIFPSGNTDPLFLLPNEQGQRRRPPMRPARELPERERFYRLLEDGARIEKGYSESYLLSGRLDSVSGKIVEGLMRHYKGDFSKVLKHVRVERFYLNQSTGEGLVSLRPNPDRTAMAIPMFPNRDLPPTQLATVAHQLMEVRGAIHGANRGYFNFSDFLRPNEHDRGHGDIARFNHLLETIEGGRTQIVSPNDPSSILTEPINIVFRGNTNDEHILEKMDTTSWPAFRRRCTFIPTPLTTRYLEEKRAHERKFSNLLERGRKAAPHVLEAFSLFVVSTRLLRPRAGRYEKVHQDLPRIINSLSVVEKALLLQERTRTHEGISLNIFREVDPLDEHNGEVDIKARLSRGEISCLHDHLREIADEYRETEIGNRLSFYDGGIGVSTAAAQDLLRQIVVKDMQSPVTVFEVLDVLKQHVDTGFDYYQHIKKNKHALAKKFAEQKQRQAAAAGQSFTEQDLVDHVTKSLQKIEKSYPAPDPATLVSEIETFAKKLVREDIYQALGIATFDAHFALRQYIEHIDVQSSGKGTVAKEYRSSSSRNNSAPDERLMRHFEDEIIQAENIVDEESRLAHRSDILTRLGTWSHGHHGQNPDEHYEEIFPNILTDIRKVRKAGAEKALTELVQNTRKYVGNEGLLQHDLTNANEPLTQKEASRWKSVKDRLIRAGYPEDTIAKHVLRAAGMTDKE